MKQPKSAAEIQIEEAIKHMHIMITKQIVRIEDAQYLVGTACKVLQKCEELRLSRNKWRLRAETAEAKLR